MVVLGSYLPARVACVTLPSEVEEEMSEVRLWTLSWPMVGTSFTWMLRTALVILARSMPLVTKLIQAMALVDPPSTFMVVPVPLFDGVEPPTAQPSFQTNMGVVTDWARAEAAKTSPDRTMPRKTGTDMRFSLCELRTTQL